MANIPNASNYRSTNKNQPFQHGGNPQPRQQQQRQQQWQPAQPRVAARRNAGESSIWPWIVGLIVIGALALWLFKFPWLLVSGAVIAVVKGIHTLTKDLEDTFGYSLVLGLAVGAIALLIYFPFLGVVVGALVIAALFG